MVGVNPRIKLAKRLISELNYHNLPVVCNGVEASNTSETLSEKSKEKQEIIRSGLDNLSIVKE